MFSSIQAVLVAVALEVAQREAGRDRFDGNGQRDAQELQHANDAAVGVLARLGTARPPVDHFVRGEQVAEEVVVDVAAAHLDRGVIITVRHGVLGEDALVVVEPVFGSPTVHDDATAAFVDGLTTEERLGAIEQAQDVETLLRREREDTRPLRRHSENTIGENYRLRPATRVRRRNSAPTVRSAATNSE